MDARARLLEIHAAVREDAAAPVDEAQILESLISPNGRPIDDSFKGKKFKNRFLDRVETEFVICFPTDALARRWSLDDLADYVAERAAKPDVNLRLAKKRIEEERRADVTIYVVLAIVLMVPTILLPMPWRIVPIAAFVSAMAYLVAVKRKSVDHYRGLAAQIDAGRS